MRIAHGVIAVDLDGTIFDFDLESWHEYGMAYFGEPKADVIQALKELRKLGYEIVIYSSRFTPSESSYAIVAAINFVSRALAKNGIPYDRLWVREGKPHADYYIDDKAMKFESWKQVLKEIKEEK